MIPLKDSCVQRSFDPAVKHLDSGKPERATE
jgi:hypothetical protein